MRASPSSRGPGRSWNPLPLVGILAALLFLVPAFAVGSPQATPAYRAIVSTGAVPLNTTCNSNYIGASAVDIAAKSPVKAANGSLLNVSMEFQVSSYRAKDQGVNLYFPTLTAVLPYLAGGSLRLLLPPKVLTINGSGWSSPSLLSISYGVTSATTFASASSYMSTSKVAVMADATTGSLTLQLRWHWSLFNPKTDVTKTGPWTLPRKAPGPGYLPATFYPADLVGLVSTSGLTAPSGSTLNITLNGSVASTYFRLVLEYPNNGTNIQSIYEYTPANATQFNATVPLTFPSGAPVPAGKYLVHVHDSCNAITHLLQVTAT